MTNGSQTRSHRRRGLLGAATTALVLVGLAAPAAAAGTTPDLGAAAHYLATTTGANGVVDGPSLAHDGYYEVFDQFGDFGLTIDGAIALAATGTDDGTLQTVVDFVNERKTDESGRTVDDWTGIGTPFASGGSIGKEALLAEIVGLDPRSFGGHDLIAGLDAVICTTTDVVNGCAAPGNYLYATSTFSQALGIIAQLRANDAANAAGPIAYLESLQNSDGSWPSLIPSSGDADVDSSAMAAMALALLPGDATATTAVAKATAWIATRQAADGGFPGITGNSTNSAGLAIQGLTLAGTTYSTQISRAHAFLAGQQNDDGGFNVAAGGQPGSDVRATTQVVSGVVGTSLGTLAHTIAPVPVAGSTTTTSTRPAPTSTTVAATGTTGADTPTTVAATATPDPANTLPATGAAGAALLATATVLIGIGLAAARAGRRGRDRLGDA